MTSILEMNKYKLKHSLTGPNSKEPSKILREYYRLLYGEPSQELVNYAFKTIKDINEEARNKKETKEEAPVNLANSNLMYEFLIKEKGIKQLKEKENFNYKEVKEILEDVLRKEKINWQIEIEKNRKIFSVNLYTKTIKLPENRIYSRNDICRLISHEIYTHVLRAENGSNQNYNIFSYGFKDYLGTEEGLAIFMEELTGTLEKERLKTIAARVIAVDNFYKGIKPINIYNQLIELDFDKEASWDITYRAYRIGGVKDFLYFKGYKKLKEAYEKIKNKSKDRKEFFDNLYTGKISLDNLEAVKSFKKRKIISKLRLPSVIKYFF